MSYGQDFGLGKLKSETEPQRLESGSLRSGSGSKSSKSESQTPRCEFFACIWTSQTGFGSEEAQKEQSQEDKAKGGE